MSRQLHELARGDVDAWPMVLRWLATATRPVEVLDVAAAVGEATLVALQVTSRSPMGALALHSGGLLVDQGWLRILGAGHPRIGEGLREWNGLDGQTPPSPPLTGGLIVAYDAVGGFFALNGGGLAGNLGEIVYFAPDTYQRDGLGLSYSDFLQFALSGDVDRFYDALRWPGWETEVEALPPDQVLSFYPFLGFEDVPLKERTRSPIPAREAWSAFDTIATRLRDLPAGSQIQVEFK